MVQKQSKGFFGQVFTHVDYYYRVTFITKPKYK